MMKRTYIAALVLSLGCAAASAQKFNPRIEVTNAYEGKVVDAQKTDVAISVPDSLLEFSYKIDYSVFDNPYNGSYEFNPYRIEMKPTERSSQRNSLYASAGIGYTFHPEARIVWSPVLKTGSFGINVYEDFTGYIGPYNFQTFSSLGDGIDVTYLIDRGRREYSGWLLDNKLGFNTAWFGKKVRGTTDLNWKFINSADTLTSRLYNEVRFKTRLCSIAPSGGGYYFRGGLDVNAATDKTVYGFRQDGVREIGGIFALTLGKRLGGKTSVEADLGFQIAAYSGLIESHAVKISATPRYVYDGKRLSASLGAGFSFVTSTDNSFLQSSVFANNATHPSVISPQAHVGFGIIPGKLYLYADATGGVDINTYSSLIASDPYRNAFFALSYNSALDNSCEKYNLVAGFKGNVAQKLQFDLRGGIVSRGNALLDALALVSDEDGVSLYPYWTYADYNEKFVEAVFDWKSDRVSVAFRAKYLMTDLAEREVRAIYPSSLTGGISATYNWQQRLFVTLNCSAASKRDGRLYFPGYLVDFDTQIPLWVDLGACAEFRYNRMLSFFLKGGNLLGQNVQQYFLHSVKGASVTAGVTLNIR